MNSLIRVLGVEIRIYGNLIRMGRLEGDKYHFLDEPEPLLEGLRKCGRRIDLFTFLQRLPDSKPRFSHPVELDNLAVIDVDSFDHWWNHQIRSYPRNRARQAEKKGVQLREVSFDDNLVKGIWRIYNESPIRQGIPFRHYGKDVQTIYREEATFLDSSVFIGAYLGEELIGFVKLVADETRTQANMMNIVSMLKHKDKAPTNALIAHSVRACANQGIRHLVYQSFSYGNKQSDTLSHFKEVNGFRKVMLPRYFVPFTPLGRLAFQLKMHRRFVDCIPNSVSAKLREMRRAWYERKFQSASDSV